MIINQQGVEFGGMSLPNMQIGLGDFSLYGLYQLLQEYNYFVDFSIDPNKKFLTATMEIGTDL